MKHISYQWVLFYIDSKNYMYINKELKDKGFKHIRAVVPTVSILRKRKKGRDIYDKVPILFNYGFMKMPTDKAFSRIFLNNLKKSISGIHAFVKSPESLHKKKKRIRIDTEDFDDFSIVATVKYEDVRRFRKLSKLNQVFSNDNIVTVPIGSYVILKGYPFEGIPATVLDINLLTNKATLLLYPEGGKMKVNLPLDNVLYSVYSNYDENKLYSNNMVDLSESITEEYLDDYITKKTF